MQEHGCLVHFVRLANALLEDDARGIFNNHFSANSPSQKIGNQLRFDRIMTTSL